MLAPPAERSAPASAGDCVWCGRSLDATASRLSGRIRCEGCGVAVTFPRPTADELDALRRVVSPEIAAGRGGSVYVEARRG